MPVPAPSIAPEDPQTGDVRALIEAHLAFAAEVTPPGHVHALGVDGLTGDDVTVFGARDRAGSLIGVVALRALGSDHGELKSMHVRAEARGSGVGRALADHVVMAARDRGYARLSLETGTYAAFAAARALYEAMGFEPCRPFADHTDNPFSTCFTLRLGVAG